MMTPEPPPETPPATDWRKQHAFGLPSGSVRAALALAVFGATWLLLTMQPGREVPDYLRDLLFIILGHYFASRHNTVRAAESGPPPLWLPSGTVRTLLVIGSLAVAVMLFRRGALTDPANNPGVVTLMMVGGFLLGVVGNSLYTVWKDRGHRSPRIVEDLRAGITVIAAGALILLVVNQVLTFYPPERVDSLFAGRLRLGNYGVENVLAAVVGFYFGSRS